VEWVVLYQNGRAVPDPRVVEELCRGGPLRRLLLEAAKQKVLQALLTITENVVRSRAPEASGARVWGRTSEKVSGMGGWSSCTILKSADMAGMSK
jgi:hypothetical protein